MAPGGSVDWMCVPRFDSPSVFGAMLGRHAGLVPGRAVGRQRCPTARRYLPGTMILETSWGTPTGWIIVRDVLLIGPWHHESDRSQDLPPHAERLRRRAHPAAHHPLRLGRGADGRWSASRCSTTGARTCRWEYTERRLPPGPRRPPTGSDVRGHPDHRPAAGLRGRAGQRAHAAQGGRRPLRRAVLGRRQPPADVRRGLRAAGVDRAPLAALAGPRPASPTTRGAATCSAARSPSRG